MKYKFRAWDTALNLWIAWEEMIRGDLSYYFSNDRYVMSGFTGIKDCRGVDIYEHDLIFHYHSNIDLRLSGIVEFKVDWSGFYFAGNRRLNTNTRYEVLGDQFLNPELIQKEKIT
ncbi:YopX family protein [Psychrobacillus sp. FSL K6-1464]|uniref:YopX family protein n=1 Tax=Psychrobacillus sp. FSL K6-1464 TaxID=2921545 RepID=UPI0030F87ED7